jgi:hypothetical protein
VNNTYWATETDTKKIISRTLDRVAWSLATMRSTGRLEAMMKMMSNYYRQGVNATSDSTRLQDAGTQGEVIDLHVDAIRPVLDNTLAIIAGTRPAIKPVSTNGDADSAAQARLAAGLIEFYDRKADGKRLEIEAARAGLICSSWWLVQHWKTDAGEEVAYDNEAEKVVYEGDVQVFAVPPWRMAAEPTATNEDERRWCIFKRKLSRWDLIAQARDPMVAEKLRNGAGLSEVSQSYVAAKLAQSTRSMFSSMDSILGEDINLEDEVWAWELRHLKSHALPSGRLLRFVEPDIILFDTLTMGKPDDQGMVPGVEYPYEELHAYEYAPSRIVGTAHGDTAMFGMMALQEFIDICTTSIATTANINGMQHLWSPGGGAPQVYQLSTGPTVIETPTKPEVIDFAALKPEMIQAADWAQGLLNKMAALNDTVLGNPQKGMAASAQALQRAQAVSFHQISQDEWLRLIERNANGKLRQLKRFARSERVTEIAGAGGAWEVKKWQASDIAGVPRFQVEPINAMSATFEGRLAIAEQMGVTGDALFDFMTTGSLKKVTETRTNQLELVERNKALLLRGVGLAPLDQQASAMAGAPVYAQTEGEVVSILKSDPHHLAIPAYLSVVNSPESRADANLIRAALGCVMESLRLWATLTPDECQAFAIPPLPSSAAMMMPPAPGGTPTEPPAPSGSEPPTASTPQGQPGQAGLPSPPPDPLTGAKQDGANLAVQGAVS